MANSLSVGLSGVGLGGSEAGAVVLMEVASEVDWTEFLSMMVRLGVLFIEGNFKALTWSDRVSKVVGHINDCMGQIVDGQAVLDLYRSREDKGNIKCRGGRFVSGKFPALDFVYINQ